MFNVQGTVWIRNTLKGRHIGLSITPVNSVSPCFSPPPESKVQPYLMSLYAIFYVTKTPRIYNHSLFCLAIIPFPLFVVGFGVGLDVLITLLVVDLVGFPTSFGLALDGLTNEVTGPGGMVWLSCPGVDGDVDGEVDGDVDDVDGEVDGGVGCPVNAFPVHVLPLDVIFIPFGHRHVASVGATASRQRWLHPPFLTLQGLLLVTATKKQSLQI